MIDVPTHWLVSNVWDRDKLGATWPHEPEHYNARTRMKRLSLFGVRVGTRA
jgi:hypothetical protein